MPRDIFSDNNLQMAKRSITAKYFNIQYKNVYGLDSIITECSSNQKG